MKQKLLSLLLCPVILAGAMLTGCGSDSGKDSSSKNLSVQKNDGKTDEANSGSSENSGGNVTDEHHYEGIELTEDEVELTVWESTAGADEFVIQAGEKFTEKYPNIKIKYVNVELGDTKAQIALDGPGGVGPDLFATPNNTLGVLTDGGHIIPVQNPEYVQNKAAASCTSAVTFKDQVWGYPISADTYALFYNRDLIKDEEVPATFDDLKTWTLDFNSKNSGKQGFLMSIDGYYSYIFTTKDGNRIFGPDGTDETAVNLNNDIAVEGMKYFQSLREILDVPAADITTSYCDGAFQAGNAAMYITGLWNVANFNDAGINFGVAALPSLPGSNEPPASFSSARTMCVSAYSDHPNEAAAFGSFMMSDEMQHLRFELTGALPSTSIVVDADYVAGFSKQLEYAFPTPAITKMDYFWDPMNAASQNIWDGADVKKEMDAVNKTILESK